MRTYLCITLMLAIILQCVSAVSTVAVTQNDGSYFLSSNNLTLKVDFGNGTVLSFQNLNGSDVYNVTNSATDVEVEWYGDLVFVTSIAGVSNDPDAGLWWQYWVNDELGSVAANKYQVNNGDLIEWKRLDPGTTSIAPSNGLIEGIVIVGAFGIAFLLILMILNRRRQ
ncbi:MAG: DUF4430 domain-containing protein [Candidatus Thorarchaeota archaeon]|nr:DUF4430 domain-containing protein [Candidatus Thorarchaeota archaeon]